ncbi:MAG: Acetyl-coenzyme A synthetase [Alphaproteobacteria bacterium MarineAlpha10_Bin3]|nr:MAG: Acetyl-coenzyme A synthetase [Alphaproteobacteria bacterium MarineAlpha10_Bin3]PPR72114.1 MAG: Acetyl-coenzyme A synthetase [Alphaproteobacteria bacterium MarineAlpha4_Bin1]
MPTPLWEPDGLKIENANITAFARAMEARWNVRLPDYPALHEFSIAEMEKFWIGVREFCDVQASKWGERVLTDGGKMPGAAFFGDARLNYAQNLLRRRDGAAAIIFQAEDKIHRTMSWRELYDAVSRLAQALAALGVGPGDCCAGFVPNMPESVIAMLATTSLGAAWTSCSPDFGVRGVLDRFGQTAPKVLFAADGYYYNGKAIDSLDRVAEFTAQLPGLKKIIILPMLDAEPDAARVPGAVNLSEAIAHYPARNIDFVQMPFNSPLYIMYSSGTTGKPKCIVHGIGGALLTHKKEFILHCDVRPGDRLFYFTTCGWMMWNWLVSGLAVEATLLLYDGSPFYPDGNTLFDFADATGMTLFGTSAKFIDAVAKAGLRPMETHDLLTLRTMTSTGSVLAPESFDYVYTHIKKDICLSSIAGGTDLLGCFVGGNPTLPVYRGEIQCRVLGMAVEVFDDDGRSVWGEKGEMVCTRPFPTMPLYFWDDADGAAYRAAYFEKYPGVWCQGDFIMRTQGEGWIIFGRSDATLNPGGVRIGTAEIYRQVEQFDEIVEAIVIGQEWEHDTRVVLFVILRDGVVLDDDLATRIRRHVRKNCTPRHVPAKIVAVADIPRTKSGKITELAVRDAVHGRAVKNAEALANPEALALYRNLPELQVA